MARQRNNSHIRTVAQAMKEMGLTDQQVADEVGCDRTWILRIRGGWKLESLRVPVRICRFLNVPIEALAPRDVV